jgi:hypothetical protein
MRKATASRHLGLRKSFHRDLKDKTCVASDHAIEFAADPLAAERIAIRTKFVGIGLCEARLDPGFPLTLSNQVAFDIPQNGRSNPADAIEVETPDGFN